MGLLDKKQAGKVLMLIIASWIVLCGGQELGLSKERIP